MNRVLLPRMPRIEDLSILVMLGVGHDEPNWAQDGSTCEIVRLFTRSKDKMGGKFWRVEVGKELEKVDFGVFMVMRLKAFHVTD